MPFHHRLLGKDRMALYSFIQSLNTTFGTSIFEPVSLCLAEINEKVIKNEKQFEMKTIATKSARDEIETIISDLSQGIIANKEEEIEKIRAVCRKGETVEIKTVKVDLYIETSDHNIYLIDLKTVKPNISNFKDFKRTLLYWIAIWLYQYPKAFINSMIAIPYNPYAPAPYERWTMRGMLDIEKELLVAEEFWDFVAGEEIYEELLNCFERVGMSLRPEIDRYCESLSN
jgi:hypothetical protein